MELWYCPWIIAIGSYTIRTWSFVKIGKIIFVYICTLVYYRWCLYLHHLSGKGYDQLRDSGCITLPSTRTLRDYTHYNTTEIGFSNATDLELAKLTKDYEPWQRLVDLTLDEMYICEGVVYVKHTGRFVGFTDMGDVNNHLERYKTV